MVYLYMTISDMEIKESELVFFLFWGRP